MNNPRWTNTKGELPRLESLTGINGPAARPAYTPSDHGAGIVHIGVGAFHRAHQAVYTDDALAASGGDWRITGISLRSVEIADSLNPQNGLYTLIERSQTGVQGRVIASVANVIAATRDRQAPLRALAAAKTRLVTLTATEKAYGIDRAALGIDRKHPSIAHDLANPRNPKGVIGLLVEALRLRRAEGLPAFTTLCCDNLPENGLLLRAGVVDFAHHVDPNLAAWIENEVAFPSSMVDRITPAATPQTLADAESLTGCRDLGAVETEPFRQWVIEDHFSLGRPEWEAGGALFVADVKPFELMKLRMLNGAHSMLAYAGFLSGRRYVRDVMQDPSLSALVDRHIRAAAATLPPLREINLDQYRRDLLSRFTNPAIAHETYQIAMDGTQKLPQRILGPALETLNQGGNIAPFAFAVAVWMRYAMGKTEAGETYPLRDPREAEIAERLSGAATAEAISDTLHGLPGLFEPDLANNTNWRTQVAGALHSILDKGMINAIAREATA